MVVISTADMHFGFRLLDLWSGTTFFCDEMVRSTDAALSVGFGRHYQDQWFASQWPPSSSLFTSLT